MARHARTGRPAASGDDRLLDLTRRLAVVVNELGLSEVEVESGGVKVRIQRVPGTNVPPMPPAVAPAAPSTVERPVVADASPTSASVTIEAPMVGTFYRASSPTAEPYVREGRLRVIGPMDTIRSSIYALFHEKEASELVLKVLESIADHDN